MRHPDTGALRRLDFIPFPEELVEVKRDFMAYARAMGLDPGEVIFDFLTPDQISEAASYDGFPARYPHWRWGMAFDSIEKSHSWGLSTIYEMVINTVPSYAYLLQGSTPLIQRMVIAHVIGHCDFFRHNAWFSGTNRNMLNEMANHAAKVKHYADRYGAEHVERFLDSCLSLENLLDPRRLYARPAKRGSGRPGAREKSRSVASPRFSGKYLESYSRSAAPAAKTEDENTEEESAAKLKPIPEKPLRAVLDFLVDHAPLEDWERNLLEIVRDEAYYFLPQRLTKIMNEGWAVYWHRRIMVARGLKPEDLTVFADEHSKIIAGWHGKLNPYRLGYFLYEDIKERWDKGRHGSEWEACDNSKQRDHWDTRAMKGMEKLFGVRTIYDDVQFIDAFLTPDFVRKSALFTFRSHRDQGVTVIESRDFQKVKAALLSHLANGGEPILELVDANYANRSELYLKHLHDGVDLKIPEARATLHALQKVWRRPVHLETLFQDKKRLYSFDGLKDSED